MTEFSAYVHSFIHSFIHSSFIYLNISFTIAKKYRKAKVKDIKITVVACDQDESTSLIMLCLILYIFRIDTATNLLRKSAIRLSKEKEKPLKRSQAVVCLSRFSIK